MRDGQKMIDHRKSGARATSIGLSGIFPVVQIVHSTKIDQLFKTKVRLIVQKLETPMQL
jgi:hypothetical protein